MFRFRLETILTQRRHVEETSQKELAEASQELAAAQAVLRETKSTHRQCMRDMRRKQRDRFRADDMLLYYPYLERLKQEIELHMKRIAAAERNVAQKRQALLEAMKKRKILDKLKEKQLQAHLTAEVGRERRFADESAAQQHARR